MLLRPPVNLQRDWGRKNMANPKPLTNDDGAARELTEVDFAQAVPFTALPAKLQALLSSPKHVSPDAKVPSTRKPAA